MWKSGGQESTDDAIDDERECVNADGVVEKKKVEQKTRREEREKFSRRQKKPKKNVETRASPSHTHDAQVRYRDAPLSGY